MGLLYAAFAWLGTGNSTVIGSGATGECASFRACVVPNAAQGSGKHLHHPTENRLIQRLPGCAVGSHGAGSRAHAAADSGFSRPTHLKLWMELAVFAMTSISPSLQHQLERLTPDQRSQVGALLAALDDAATRETSAPRQPGGLLGKMHSHADFDTPLSEEFLIP